METFAIAKNIEKKWGWLLALGLLSVLCGLIAITFVGVTSVLSVLYLGVLFMVIGISEIAFAIQTRKDGHLWYHLLMGVLFSVGGFLIFMNPIANLILLTFLLATLLIVSGVVNVIGSFVDRFTNWGWFAINGAVGVVAGYLILSNPLESSMWLIGLLVGIEMMFRGFAWISLGLAGRKLAHRGQSSSMRPATA
ncbi:MAG: HdeD family acid-resistance protein [Bdellovibrionales bacterium]|nr:HdeD family acid-resistance protein [Bdellovibrionales bacterium]